MKKVLNFMSLLFFVNILLISMYLKPSERPERLLEQGVEEQSRLERAEWIPGRIRTILSESLFDPAVIEGLGNELESIESEIAELRSTIIISKLVGMLGYFYSLSLNVNQSFQDLFRSIVYRVNQLKQHLNKTWAKIIGYQEQYKGMRLKKAEAIILERLIKLFIRAGADYNNLDSVIADTRRKLHLLYKAFELSDNLLRVARKKNFMACVQSYFDVYIDKPFLDYSDIPFPIFLYEDYRDAIAANVNLYKIHLMPKDEDIINATIALLDIIKNDPELQSLISQVKVKAAMEPLVKEYCVEHPLSEYYLLPKIIIYIAKGKDVAQRVLNKIYESFKNLEGINRKPGFNKKVTSFIYFAQGNRDDKLQLPEYFNFQDPHPENRGVYFKSNVTGEEQEYRLINPATGTY